MFKFRKIKEIQEVTFKGYPVGPLRDAAASIWGNQFLEAIAHLNVYFATEDKTQNENDLIHYHRILLRLVGDIIITEQAQLDVRRQAAELCKAIYVFWIETYTPRAEDLGAKINLDDLTQGYRDLEDYVKNDLTAQVLSQHNIETQVLEITVDESSEREAEELPITTFEKAPNNKEKKALAKIFLQKGDDAFGLKDYVLAVANYETSISNYPAFAKAYFNLAKCFRRLGEQYQAADRFRTRDLPEGSASARQFFISSPNPEEMEFYQKSEKAFAAALKFKKIVTADFYWEYAYLKEIQGAYEEEAEFRRKACQLEKISFGEHYSKLLSAELETQRLQLVYRYAFIARDQEFKNYCQQRGEDNYKIKLYLGCAFIYASYEEDNAAFQQCLLAWSSCKTHNERLSVLDKAAIFIRSSVDATILNNIFGLTTDEELASIRTACETFVPEYIKLIQDDLTNQRYEQGAKKFLIIARDDFFHGSIGAALLCQIGTAFTKIRNKDLDAALACYNAAHRKDPACPGLEPSRSQLLALHQTRINLPEIKKAYIAGMASPAMYKYKSNDVDMMTAKAIENKSANLGCNW